MSIDCSKGREVITRQYLGVLHRLTEQPLERVERDTNHDHFMTAKEAREYGLVDHVLERLAPGQLPTRPQDS